VTVPESNDDRLRTSSTPENSWLGTHEFDLLKNALLHDAVTLPTGHEQTGLWVDHGPRRDQRDRSNVNLASQHRPTNYRGEAAALPGPARGSDA
jgi:hypothetical protein